MIVDGVDSVPSEKFVPLRLAFLEIASVLPSSVARVAVVVQQQPSEDAIGDMVVVVLVPSEREYQSQRLSEEVNREEHAPEDTWILSVAVLASAEL